tara:strand:- start:1892 stop:2518 length:627 start_codon:yes stop_codon:yes gene_type:complete
MKNNKKLTAIIDYDAGNPKSIQNMLKKLEFDSIITRDKKEILRASHIILPGVGHFKYGMEQLIKLDLVKTLQTLTLKENIPFLGICLGMQLLTEYSEEGNINGLSIIKNTKTIKFNTNKKRIKIPHMGWNSIQTKKNSLLFKGIKEPRFYFVHSYRVFSEDEEVISSLTKYENEFISAIEQQNTFGVQFHPEKSHKFGFQLFRNFLTL